MPFLVDKSDEDRAALEEEAGDSADRPVPVRPETAEDGLPFAL
jgi:hypothetical protein